MLDGADPTVVGVGRRAGPQPENVARITMYVLDRHEYMANAKAVGQSYRKHMGKHYPAMTLVEIKSLLEEGAKLELEATAAL